MKTTLGELPDLAKSFSKMKVILDLEEVTCTQTNAIAISIYAGLQKQQTNSVIKFVKDGANDNRPLMAKIIGEELLSKIETL